MSEQQLPKLEVCFSPALLNLYDTKGSIVVIIDVFRATSTIAAALHNGAEAIIPVATVEECISIGENTPNSITAGERNGQVVEGLQYGNSPSAYPKEFVGGKTLVLTTTNGTKLLHMVEEADEIITGSFLNLSAVADYLRSSNKNVLLACAAWKDRFNLEDALFAGAVASKIKDGFDTNCDSLRAALSLYHQTEGAPLISYLKNSAHYRRLSAFGLEHDMEYCATPDLHPVLPKLVGDKLIAV